MWESDMRNHEEYQLSSDCWSWNGDLFEGMSGYADSTQRHIFCK